MIFDIIISQYKDITILKRTLKALNYLILPKELGSIILVENGGYFGANKLCAEFENLPIKYYYLQNPSLVEARNLGATVSNADYIVFFDNYLRFENQTLIAYVEAFKKYGQDYFYGGPVEPYFENNIDSSLLQFMPLSVKGLSFNCISETVIDEDSFFLSANHAVSLKAKEHVISKKATA